MELIDFIKIASGVDKKNLPKSTASLCLVELTETDDNEIVSNIKQILTLITTEIYLDCFVDGCDENGYIEARLKFNNPYSSELNAAWSMLEEYRKLMSTANVDIDTDITIDTDTMLELIIMPTTGLTGVNDSTTELKGANDSKVGLSEVNPPSTELPGIIDYKELSDPEPVFLELAFPINFNLCSSEPGKAADTLDFVFNTNSCRFHENNYVDMEQMNRETNEYLKKLEDEIRQEQEIEEERILKEEEYIRSQAKLRSQSMLKAEESGTIRVGGRANH
ncbi:hypothetical protein [Lacrimispora amygdalina]|uniref:hypothetical protein n=1 Tax=Lacrimispora amygdalina TaxID=253257 RepID=UPI000BE32FD1|nr:hypothetical protein [Lacrimispora amygdalina]